MNKRLLNIWGLIVSLTAITILGGALYAAMINRSKQSAAVVMTQTSAPTQVTDDISAILTQKAAAGATALARPPVTPEIAPTGIFDDERFKAQWKAFGFSVENAWFGIVNGNLVTIFAGAYTNDTERGRLQVSMMLPYQEFQAEFAPPANHGTLTIVDEQDNRLEILAADGATLYFDVPAMSFVSSMIEVVPTMTPLPTYTPIILPTELPPSTGYPQLPTPTVQSGNYPVPSQIPTEAP